MHCGTLQQHTSSLYFSSISLTLGATCSSLALRSPGVTGAADTNPERRLWNFSSMPDKHFSASVSVLITPCILIIVACAACSLSCTCKYEARLASCALPIKLKAMYRHRDSLSQGSLHGTEPSCTLLRRAKPDRKDVLEEEEEVQDVCNGATQQCGIIHVWCNNR